MFIQYITQNCSPNQPWRSCIKKIWHLKIEETFLKEHGWLMILVCFKPSTVQQNEKHGETWFLQFLGKKKKKVCPTNDSEPPLIQTKKKHEGRNFHLKVETFPKANLFSDMLSTNPWQIKKSNIFLNWPPREQGELLLGVNYLSLLPLHSGCHH